MQGRSPLDLLSKGLKAYLTSGTSTEVYTWGNGANYQLGTGAEGLQLVPYRVENLHGEDIAQVAAAKFHSAAVSRDGRLFTWGFGRGGRLGEHRGALERKDPWHSSSAERLLILSVAMPVDHHPGTKACSLLSASTCTRRPP